MTNPTHTQQPSHPKRRYYGLAVLALFGLADAILLATNNTTILISPHHGQDNTWIAVEVIMGGFAALIGFWWAMEGTSVARQIVASLIFGFAGLIVLTVFLVFAGDVVAGRRDFPSGRTIRYKSVLRLSGADYSHGKSPHGAVQTTPLWANFHVSNADYNFLRAHRSAEEVSHDPKGDEISSKGRFCIRVELEQADGAALRVLNAGTRDLPVGSVILCPPGTPELPEQFMRAWRADHARTTVIAP